MNTIFDHIAQDYDKEFTDTLIGKAQRDLVWEYLNKQLPENKELNILELNCGTGEDAVFMAGKGHQVLATDNATKMLEVTSQKAFDFGLEEKIRIQHCSLDTIQQNDFPEKFDLIFSDFGGLNCISPDKLKVFFETSTALLKSDGRMILVIMGRFCLWESLYYMAKMKIKSAFRRLNRKSVNAKVGEEEMSIWYYSAGNIKKSSKDKFEVNCVLPVGIFIPPSYLNPFFKPRIKLFAFLLKMEKKVKKISFYHKIADHYLIDLKRKEK